MANDRPSLTLADFDKFVKNKVAEFHGIAEQLTFFRKVRAEAKENGNIPLAREAHQRIQMLHGCVDEKKTELKPVLDNINNTLAWLPRKGL